MNTRTTGYAGTLLVLFAFLAGGAALWTVAGQASGQDEATPATVAADVEADAQGEQATASEFEGRRVEDILAMLASGMEVPVELQDPAFDYYVDLGLLGDAWVKLDPELLTDLALQFAEGERVLLRPHRAIRGADLMEIAIRTAAVKSDTKTLERLEKAVQRTDNKELAAELANAKNRLTNAEGESAWMLPVATTSAQDFATYKGMLQDIEAAIVVRDVGTLETLHEELKAMTGLPATHREKLDSKVSQALEDFKGAEEGVSKAAKVLDKLAYATRRGPLSSVPSTGRSPGMSLGNVSRWLSLGARSGVPQLGPGAGMLQQGGTPTVTLQPQSPTRCQAVSTTCPSGSAQTYCPAIATRCPPQATQCSAWQSVCPTPGSCNTPTQRPSGPTQCAPQECQWPTQRPDSPTQCAPQQCQTPTQRPSGPTQCAPQECQWPTQRPDSPTQCAPHLCQTPTQRPLTPTQCSPAQGKCERPTLYPSVPTSCPAIQTRCPYSETYCPPVCGQQQQQKQRWIPPRKGKYGSGGYYPTAQPGGSQFGAPGGMTTPYPRRYDSNLN